MRLLAPRSQAAADLAAVVAAAPRGEDLVAVGLDLSVPSLLSAYRVGLFPMGLGLHGRRPIGWWSPDPRGVLRAGGIRVSRSLRKSVREYDVTWDHAFSAVVRACADPGRSGRWITRDIAEAYQALHRAGYAHSVEVWRAGELVGGLYGVSIGGLFAGESMFHRAVDASKVALVALDDLVYGDGRTSRLIDTQWSTPHLESLGVVEVSRPAYRDLLRVAVAETMPPRLREPGRWAPRDTRARTSAPDVTI
jgi:leucyl/phenylalanyl-tRNA---protein transferase